MCMLPCTVNVQEETHQIVRVLRGFGSGCLVTSTLQSVVLLSGELSFFVDSEYHRLLPLSFAYRNYHHEASGKRARGRKGLVCIQTPPIFEGGRVMMPLTDELFYVFSGDGDSSGKVGDSGYPPATQESHCASLAIASISVLFAFFPENGFSFPRRTI